MVIINDLEWPMLSYYVQKCHAVNREGGFNLGGYRGHDHWAKTL